MSAQWLRYSPKRQKAKKPKTQLTKARNPKTTKTRVENRKNPPPKKTNKTNSDWQLLRKNAMAPMQGIVINAVAAVMDYAQWLLSDGVYKPIDELDIDIGNDNELLSLY